MNYVNYFSHPALHQRAKLQSFDRCVSDESHKIIPPVIKKIVGLCVFTWEKILDISQSLSFSDLFLGQTQNMNLEGNEKTERVTKRIAKEKIYRKKE